MFDYDKVEFDYDQVEFDYDQVEFVYDKVEFDYDQVEFDYDQVIVQLNSGQILLARLNFIIFIDYIIQLSIYYI